MERRKVILFIFISLILILTSNANAIGNINGHDWNKLNREGKTSYIKGIIDGLNLMMVSMMVGLDSEGDIQAIIEQLKKDDSLIIIENKEEINKVVDGIDETYEEKNLDKTIFDLVMEEEVKVN